MEDSCKMEDSYIIANFHSLCRFCLHKTSLSLSVFGANPDDDTNISLATKISECFEIQINPNDGLPGKMCYKCLFKLDKCSKFRLQCIQSENRLRQISQRCNELDTSNSSELSSSNYNYKSTQETMKQKGDEYLVEDSVVMVVDPSMEYDSSEESEPTAEKETLERDNTPENEPVAETLLKNVFLCQYCDQAFVSEEKCKEHEKACHDPTMPYKCIECSVVFAERTQYIQHLRQIHGNGKPYLCRECDKCFGRRSDLKKHSIVHTGIRPYQCQYCMKSFSRNTNLSKHLRVHADHKPIVCLQCPRSFVTKVDLDKHVLTHARVKPYACKSCSLTFARRDKLAKHEVKHLVTSTQLNKSSESDHDMVVNVNPFSNLMSSPPSSNRNSLTGEYELPRVPEHMFADTSFVTHTGKNPSTSGKVNQNSPPKPKPISNKNKPKNIKCHQCPKRLSSLDAYKTHISMAHIGSRVFQCKVCFKKFARKRELDRHSTLHTGMKPFACSQCDKKFTRKDKLNKHEETHECLVVNMPCIECGATFEKKADLVAHIKSHFTDDFDEKVPDENPDIKKEDLEDGNFPLDENFYDLET